MIYSSRRNRDVRPRSRRIPLHRWPPTLGTSERDPCLAGRRASTSAHVAPTAREADRCGPPLRMTAGAPRPPFEFLRLSSLTRGRKDKWKVYCFTTRAIAFSSAASLTTPRTIFTSFPSRLIRIPEGSPPSKPAVCAISMVPIITGKFSGA